VDEPVDAQFAEDVLEEARRDRLRGGEHLALRGLLLGAATRGELHHRAHRVVGLG
jgi:hypothetical protein